MDAFLLDWKGLKGYAFPPFCLIGRCLVKVRKEGATIVLVAPVWPSQPWYATLLNKLVRAGRAYLGGLEGLRRRYRQSGFSQTATSLLTSACCDGTCKAYEGPWSKWSRCCDHKQMIHFRSL